MGFMKTLKRVLSGGWKPKEKRPPNIVLISSRPIQEDEFIPRRKVFPSVDPIAATTEDVIVRFSEECEDLQTPVSYHISQSSDSTEEKSTEDKEADRSDLNQTPDAVPAETKVHPTQEHSVDDDAGATSLAEFQTNITLERINHLMNQVMKLQDGLSKSKEDFVLLAALYLTSKETFELETHIHEEEMTVLNVDLRDCRLKIAQLELEAQETRRVSSSIATTPVGTQTEVSEHTTTTTAMTEFTQIQPAEPVAPLVDVELSVHDVADSPTSSLVISEGVAADVDCLQTQGDCNEISSVPAGLKSKATALKHLRALTDSRYDEHKEDLNLRLWLENRLLQVETERDWIIEEKLNLEKTVAEKAEMAIQYISDLISENQALSGYLESETERADTAVKHSEEEKALRIQDRERFRRLRQDHEEISYELKSTQIDLEESQSRVAYLEEQIELLRLSTYQASVFDSDDKNVDSFQEETDVLTEPIAAAPVFTCSDIRYKGRPIEGYTVILNSHAPQQYDTGVKSSSAINSSTVDFVIPTPVPSHVERLDVNPPEVLFIIRDEIVKTDLGHTVQLTNIESVHFGRILGRGGHNVKKLKEKYNNVNIKVSIPQNTPDQIIVVLSSGSPTDRNCAADEIIEDLPVEVAVFFRASQNVKKRARNSCPFVTVQDIGQGNFLLSGKLRQCRKVFEDLN
ncbi:hypothetical protein DAPPUDRAFT_246804 [Daphnia pulex]|uniref:K Homology domain-containing protein n=1 Tax=Daphnia pulex TaxID=6669 RepID=E9GR92_DAPPU|nr:hypothetical protein DAPPUDRAFT_246804 [Daphnia pulex]|eukprot:EFX77971.1 hypothetical protein DAPPUDRAFT_246804 [Daphnia pulex]